MGTGCLFRHSSIDKSAHPVRADVIIEIEVSELLCRRVNGHCDRLVLRLSTLHQHFVRQIPRRFVLQAELEGKGRGEAMNLVNLTPYNLAQQDHDSAPALYVLR